MSEQMYYFSSPTCNPCLAVKPVIAELKEDNPSIQWFDIDTTNDPQQMAKAYNVTHVPTLVAVYDGKVVGRHSGTQFMGYFALLKRLTSAKKPN